MPQHGAQHTANLSYGREASKIIYAEEPTVRTVVTPVKSTRGEPGDTQPHFERVLKSGPRKPLSPVYWATCVFCSNLYMT